MKKILFVFNHPAYYKVRLLNELAKEYDLTVIFERDKNADRNKKFYDEQNFNFKLIKIKGIKISNENFFSNGVKNHIKNNKYDLIIMNGYSNFAEMIAIKYLKKHHINYCLYINGGIINENEPSWKRKLKRKYISGANSYMSPDLNSNKYLEFYGADKNRIYNYTYSTVYENEILNKILSKEETNAIRENLGYHSKNIYISCGQLIKRKNYQKLIKSWPQNNDDLLLIVGEGKEEETIKNYLKENNVENVKLLGYLARKDIFKLYQISDAFIFPSQEDIYGHVINEAMSQGLPVISTTNVNSSKKLIKENFNGVFLKTIDEDNIKKALEEIKNCKKENSLLTAKENTIEKMVKDNIKIINEL